MGSLILRLARSVDLPAPVTLSIECLALDDAGARKVQQVRSMIVERSQELVRPMTSYELRLITSHWNQPRERYA